MSMVSEVSSQWVYKALNYFPESIQEQLVRKMIDSDFVQKDVIAQLQTASRLKRMGFSIHYGNSKEGVFQVQCGKEDPFWVVSCSLSRFLTPLSGDLHNLVGSLERGRFQASNDKTLSVTIEEVDFYTECNEDIWDIFWRNGNKTLIGENRSFYYRQFKIKMNAKSASASSQKIQNIVYPGLEKEISLGILRAVKSSIKKTSNEFSTMISMNINLEPFASDIKDLGFEIFDEDQSRAIFSGSAKSRLSGILVSYGNPALENSLTWEFLENKRLNSLTLMK